MEGPFNPNHYSELGLQVNRFGTPPTFFQPYNPAYYIDLLEDHGFFVSARFHTRKNENIGDYVLERKKIRKLVAFSVAIKKAYRHTRVYSLIVKTLCRVVLKYQVLETTWMSEDNIPAVRAAEHFALKPDKRFAIYKKKIS